MIRLALALAVTLMTAPALHALDAVEMFDDPVEEARAREIGRALRCLVCQNESIFDSNAGLARDLRVLVRDRMSAGDSDDEVIAYVAERYGDYVLLKPRVTTQTYLLWGAPAIFLGLGGLSVLAYHRRRRQAPGEVGLSDEDRAKAQRLLQGEKS
ncbi:cytochrome c-type biogenesis protein [Aliiroseovarius subalbicans]|uniref:cytochrome c-type biogenesis protein n=1 Tax=Aliiroseovarius subalbicans TaxID=2925840 RepID=UPI001F5AB761|nr:cytochrome c-type biogenesis protein [Aliiroseovarius subalbicans]MCI2399645.1 cytochrome c-type biogenesis protein CcmH [Aliiroseovarius subalbicans]